MKTLHVSKWSLPVVFAALVAAVALVMGMQPAHAQGTMTVHVKQASISDHAGDCPGGVIGAHFVINQIADAPDSIEVSFADGSSQTVVLAKQSGPVGHYNAMSDALVVDATAEVPDTWQGQFVLSNYFCGSTTTTSSSSSSSSTTSSSGTPTS